MYLEHTLYTKDAWRLYPIHLVFRAAECKSVEDTYFEVKNATASVAPKGPLTLGLQTNVSAN